MNFINKKYWRNIQLNSSIKNVYTLSKQQNWKRWFAKLNTGSFLYLHGGKFPGKIVWTETV